MSYTLFIGNKNTDAWSIAPWVLMKQKGIAFNEQPVRNEGPENVDVKNAGRVAERPVHQAHASAASQRH